MSQIATLSEPDKYELKQALKKQKQAIKDKKRDTHLENLDILLSRIPSFSQYQPMEIKHRSVVNHLSENMFLISYFIFNLI